MTVVDPLKPIEVSLFTVLNVTSVKTTAGATGVFNKIAPQTQLLPYVIFQWQGGGLENDHDKDSANMMYTVKALADTDTKAAQIHAACFALLHKQVLTVTGWVNFWTRFEDVVSYAEVDPAGKVVYHVGGMYRIRNEQS